MANLSWTVIASIGTRQWDGPTISDAKMDRFLDWLWVQYPQWVDPDDESQGLKPKTPANLAAAFDDFAQGQWNGVVAQVLRWERSVAAKSASDAVDEIDV